MLRYIAIIVSLAVLIPGYAEAQERNITQSVAGRTILFSDGIVARYGADGSYTFQGFGIEQRGRWLHTEDKICVAFENGGTRCDRYYEAGGELYSRMEGGGRSRIASIGDGNWTRSDERVAVDVQEDGHPIHLEIVLYKPSGAGPHKLAIFNHGSTGRGTDPALFTRTSAPGGITQLLLERGYAVAFPQRRGRGRSDGRYDEGFGPDRRRGYSCDPVYALPGLDRAIADLHAALDALARDPALDARRVLMIGHSRGGILSVAFAGTYPQAVSGVINFVGGWLGTRCASGADINQAGMRRGASYSGQMLWLYGTRDDYYDRPHIEALYRDFTAHGGQAELDFFDTGHGLDGSPDLWRTVADRYLARHPLDD